MRSKIFIATTLVYSAIIMAEVGEVSIRYLEYPASLPGKVLKAHKELDPNTGRMVLKVENDNMRTVRDLLDAEADEVAAMKYRRGCLSKRVVEKMESMRSGERVKALVQLKMPEASYLDKTRHSMEELEANSRAVAELQPALSAEGLLLRHGLLPVSIAGSASMIVEIEKEQLQNLKDDSDVAEVELFQEPVTLGPELSVLATSAYMGSLPAGSGSGVHAATFESGITSSFLSCMGVSATYDVFNGTDLQLKRHSQYTFKDLTLAAPAATFYHRHSLIFNGTDDVNYIINNSLQTLSMSYEKGGQTPYRSTNSEFLTMDDFAYRFPYPVFVNPTGNSGYAYEVNWQCYNAISVGNVRNTSGTTYEMADCTQTKNPPPVYGSCIAGSGADCAGDREMPYIVAPGIAPTGSFFETTCTEGNGSIGCGTSHSAPIANGMAADVIAADSRFYSWPEKVRATLILTAQNVESGDWSVSSDERDGSGTISGAEAVSFAKTHTSVSPNNTAAEKGLAANSFYAADFSANKRFNFLVPNPKPSGKHLRVVLTWDSNPAISAGTNALSDLDLVVQKNGGTATSASWDSNVEVVDVAAADLTAGSSYYIDVAPYANRIPASGSRTDYFYYSLAWEFVKDHAP